METNRFAVMAKRWYIVHAYSNFEQKVADSIREQARQRGLSHLFEDILVPKEKVVEVRRGRKVDAERKFFPGYVLVKMELTDDASVRCRGGSHHPSGAGRYRAAEAFGNLRSGRAGARVGRTVCVVQRHGG